MNLDREREPATGADAPARGAAPPAHLPLLAEPRRRRLLRTVRREGPLGLGTLAGDLAAATDEVERATPRRCQEVYLQLSRVDVPLLAGAGLLAYDEDAGTVSLAVPDETLDALLADVDERVSATG